MIIKKIWAPICVAMVAFSLIGCATSEATVPTEGYAIGEPAPVTEVTEAENEETIQGLFDIEGLDIASYRIRGEGPDGAYFDWIAVDSPKVAISDIRRGQWTLYAQGLNKDGMPVVQGKLETFLSEDSPIDNLVFDEHYGKGDLRCALAWNPAQVQHPGVEVYIRPADGGDWTARDISEIAIGNGTAMWTAENVESGSYIVRFILKDRSTIVSGAAAALRVIDDKVSVGSVRLTIGDLSHVYGISLDNEPVETIDGYLMLDAGKAVFETEAPDLFYDWYIDGTYQPEASGSDSIALVGLAKGYHRVDCVVRTEHYGSIDSDSIHIYTDGERVAEVSEDDVNAAVEPFDATKENAEMLFSAESVKAVDADAETLDAIAAEAEAPAEAPVMEAPAEEPVLEMGTAAEAETV